MKTILMILLVLFILYLCAIKPRILKKPNYQPFFSYKYAHRGLHNMNPYLKEENNPYYCNEAAISANSSGVNLSFSLRKSTSFSVFIGIRWMCA